MHAQPIYQTLYRFLTYFLKKDFICLHSNIITDFNNNFTFLECDSNHIATSNKDTFILNNPQYILRTHTTNFQHEFIAQYTNSINNKDKINGLNYGTVFRKDDSSRHSYFFHQIDGILFNNNLSIKEYITELIQAIKHILNTNATFRVRKSYFPFTHPSFEIDIFINQEYLEIAGCGQIHYNILNKCQIEPKDTFAFGLGIERIASIAYGESNIKKLRLM